REARPDPAKLWDAALPVPGHPGLRVLSPVDMVLHSAVHLFHEGEFSHGLRGLFDLHRLLTHFGAQPGFWEALPVRACALEVERSLFYALRYAVRLLGTAVPAPVLAAARGRPHPILLGCMDQLFERVLQPNHPDCGDWLGPPARFALYLRGNWLRMPPPLLARHLLRKALISGRKPVPEAG
ncbi:MAG: nucleotidyltransferase family protein, partial [Telluria sp.]